MEYKPKVLVTAPVGTRSGYGSRSRDLIRALIKRDKYQITINPVPWGNTPQNALDTNNPKDQEIINRIAQPTEQPDVHIHCVVPNEFTPAGKFNIGVTAGLETTLVPMDWIEGCNRMDLVLCSSKFAKESIAGTRYKNEAGQELKVTTPIDIIFEGADLEIYKKTNEFSPDVISTMDQVKEDWNFLFVGHWLQGGLGRDRKDVGGLIKTFYDSFSHDSGVGLILKTAGATPSIMDAEDIQRKINDIKAIVTNSGDKKLPNVYLLHGDLTDNEMNQLYNHPKIKANISFTHGEGFGRPLLEASLSEKPILAPKWSGHVDFLGGKRQKWLPGGLIKVEPGSFPDNMYVEGQQWFGVNYGAAAEMMKSLRINYRKHLAWSKKLAANNRKNYSFDAMSIKIEQILNGVLPKFTQTVDVNLPKLNLPKLEKVG